MILANITLSTILAGAVALSGCATNPLPPTSGTDVTCKTKTESLTCATAKVDSGNAMEELDFASHPWFKDKPWLGKILVRSNQQPLDSHKEALEVRANIERSGMDYGPWCRDKPWLGKIYYGSSQLRQDQDEGQPESESERVSSHRSLTLGSRINPGSAGFLPTGLHGTYTCLVRIVGEPSTFQRGCTLDRPTPRRPGLSP